MVRIRAHSQPLIVFVVVLAVLNPSCSSVAPSVTTHITFIENVTLISPERDAPLEEADVVIQDGRIAQVGENLRPAAGAQRLDGRGRYLIPGLIDSHVHAGHPVALDDDVIDKRPELLAAYRAHVPRAYLAFGFTTVLDVDPTPEELAWFDRTPLHPRLYHCGRAVRVAGGYGAQRIPPSLAEKDFPSLVYEPSQAERWPATLDHERHSPARIVQRAAEEGGACVKVFVERGFGVFDWPVPQPDTLDALRAEATRRGLKLAVHATSVESWRAALNAHADVIAHGLWHWPGPRLNSAAPGEARAVIEAAARAGVRVQPTLRVLQSDRSIFDSTLLDDPRLAWSLPEEILAYLRTPEAQSVRRTMADAYEQAARSVGETSGAAALIAVAIERAKATTRLMVEAQVPLIFGSDTPSGEGLGNPPGLNGRLELQEWSEAGISLIRILRAATLDNAVAFGLERELGSIEVGKRADLVLLTANPLQSVGAYDAIETVLLNGEPIARESMRPAHSPDGKGR
ncbi:MAG: amidohydrolase family protein [Vicinamibacterales bacterium]